MFKAIEEINKPFTVSMVFANLNKEEQHSVLFEFELTEAQG